MIKFVRLSVIVRRMISGGRKDGVREREGGGGENVSGGGVRLG